jgi:phytoene dehydrogenase-like protein
MAPSLLIIGGGIAGLSAGCYARMNGFPTTILEQHTIPGGLCTAWTRGAFRFDGCLHWLVGTRPGSGFHQIWEELGVLRDTRVINHEEFTRVVGADGKTLILYTDADRLEAHLLALAPEDAPLIREITRAIRKMAHFDTPVGKPMELLSPLEMIGLLWRMRGAIGPLLQYGQVTVGQLMQRFTNPFLRAALPAAFNLPGMPAVGFLATMGWMHARNAGYLEGGSLPMARRLETRYRNLGGEIRYQALVESILVEEGRAVGVRLAGGDELRADYVISAADGHATLFNMLDGQYLDAKHQEAYDNWPVFPPLIQVSLGWRATCPHCHPPPVGCSLRR